VVATLIAVAVPVLNFILLVAVGLDLTGEDFFRVRQRWTLLLAGLVLPLVLLPIAALALTRLSGADPLVITGMLLLAACPIGGISNAYSYLAGASTALSVTLTALSCLGAAITMPIISKGFDLLLREPLGLTAPVPLLIGQLVPLLVVPVGVGMWLRRQSPAIRERYGPALRRIAFIGTGFVLLTIIVNTWDVFLAGLSQTVPLTAAFVLISLILGWVTGTLVTADARDRFTIAAGFASRNVAVAMAVAVTMLGRLELAPVAVTYAVVEVPLLLGAVAWFRRRSAAV
jgi:BASS family bile acid:Na+ symporter